MEWGTSASLVATLSLANEPRFPSVLFSSPSTIRGMVAGVSQSLGIYSDYVFVGWGYSSAAPLIAWVACTIAFTVLLCASPARPGAAVAAGILNIVAAVAFILIMCFISGFGFVTPLVTGFLCVLYPIAPAALFAGLLLSPSRAIWTRLFRKPPPLDEGAAAKKSDVDEPRATPSGSVGGESRPEELPAFTPAGSMIVLATGEPMREADGIAAVGNGSFLTAIKATGPPEWLRMAAVAAALIVIDVFCHLMTFGACYGGNPNDVTTWAGGRNNMDEGCRAGAVCHVYTLVGPNMTALTLVAHVVAAKPQSADHVVMMGVAFVCPTALADKAASAVASSPSCTAASPGARQFLAKPVNDDLLDEDWRYVSRFALSGLWPDTLYSIDVTFVTANAGNLSTAGGGRPPHRVRTLPLITAPGNQTAVPFVGGGDYDSSGLGRSLLSRARSQLTASGMAPTDPYFVFVGGDLAYANNLRMCYRRWDLFLRTIAMLTRPSDGAQLPLLVCPGNHEGGGYLHANTQKEREQRYHHYTYFFPSAEYIFNFSQPEFAGLPSSATWRGDPTVTFQRHYIGSSAWLVLDSGIMFAVDEQAAFAEDTMKEFASQNQLPSGVATLAAGRAPVNVIIALYHNPAFPSVRSFSDPQSTKMREAVVPLLFRYNTSLVFENHDHAYKRTHELVVKGTSFAVANASSLSYNDRRGMVFVGDGSLGVRDISRPINDGARWYSAAIAARNYAQFGVIWPNGTVSVASLDIAGGGTNPSVVENEVFDRFVVTPRANRSV